MNKNLLPRMIAVLAIIMLKMNSVFASEISPATAAVRTGDGKAYSIWRLFQGKSTNCEALVSSWILTPTSLFLGCLKKKPPANGPYSSGLTVISVKTGKPRVVAIKNPESTKEYHERIAQTLVRLNEASSVSVAKRILAPRLRWASRCPSVIMGHLLKEYGEKDFPLKEISFTSSNPGKNRAYQETHNDDFIEFYNYNVYKRTKLEYWENPVRKNARRLIKACWQPLSGNPLLLFDLLDIKRFSNGKTVWITGEGDLFENGKKIGSYPLLLSHISIWSDLVQYGSGYGMTVSYPGEKRKEIFYVIEFKPDGRLKFHDTKNTLGDFVIQVPSVLNNTIAFEWRTRAGGRAPCGRLDPVNHCKEAVFFIKSNAPSRYRVFHLEKHAGVHFNAHAIGDWAVLNTARDVYFIHFKDGFLTQS